MDLTQNNIAPEKALLVSVDFGEKDAEESLLELEELAKTAGAEVAATLSQKKQRPDTATFIGKGKLDEAAEFCKANELDLMVFDAELSPTQIRNIEKETGMRVIDRTMLILDIFANRARAKEGKLQVELAQLKYMLPRLTGKGIALSRLGGGIGTRGPGETKLETDRRHIRRKITALKTELESVERHRASVRRKREKDGVQTVAIVGYTNAGKSTLMNALTKAGVLAEDKLFATLDPTARALKLPDGRTVMLIDTVGLVRRLPHHLVEAFRSTLEEAAKADVILNVCDISSDEAQLHLEVTKSLLESLGCGDTPVIPVFNKIDKAEDIPINGGAVRISALKGEGLEHLLDAIVGALPPTMVKVKLLLPFSQGGLAAQLRKEGTVTAEEYREDGLFMEVLADYRTLPSLQPYFTD